MPTVFPGRKIILAALISAAALAGCGSDDSDSSSPTTVGGPTTSLERGEFCDLIKTYSDRFTSLAGGSATPDQLQEIAEDAGSSIQTAIDSAPAELKTDVTVIAGAAEQYLLALKNVDYDMAKLPPDATQSFATPDLAASAARLTAYSQNTCGTRG